MYIYDESYIGLTSYNKFAYNVFGIHKSWYYLYDQPVGIKNFRARTCPNAATRIYGCTAAF